MMIRIRGRMLETSHCTFRHPDGHRIEFISCVHLGGRQYYLAIQRAIDRWRGVIFEERVTGDNALRELIPKDKKGIQGSWQVLHRLQRMKSQRKILLYPREKTTSSDISWNEIVSLYDSVTVRLPYSKKFLTSVPQALEKNPQQAYTVLWFLLITCLQGWGDPEEIVSHIDELDALESRFADIRKHVLSLSKSSSRAFRLYQVLEHEYLHEPTTSFVPERDTSVLRNVDIERCGHKRNTLIIYGGGHYRGIAKGLYDRRYVKIHTRWNRVCRLPAISLDDFTYALLKISKSL